MRRSVWLLAILFLWGALGDAQTKTFRGTVVHMEMKNCTQDRGFVSAMSGNKVVSSRPCPEYIVMSEKVVYVLVGRKAGEFMPLAEDVTFIVNDGDVTVAYQDEKNRSHFAVRRMVLREDWERFEHNRKLALSCSATDPSTPRDDSLRTTE